jgi:hypothetical protein
MDAYTAPDYKRYPPGDDFLLQLLLVAEKKMPKMGRMVPTVRSLFVFGPSRKIILPE